MIDFPKKIEFVSCNAVLELVDDLAKQVPVRRSMLSKSVAKPVVKPKSATYKYVYVPQIKSEVPSKKIGTTVEYTLDYLTRLNGFGLIKF